MENLDKQKKRFLDGEITAAEYEAIAKIIEKEIKEKELIKIDNIKIDSPIKKEDTSYNTMVITTIVVMITIFVLFTINFRLSSPKPIIINNIENNVDTEYVKVDTTAAPPPTLDSLSIIEELAENAAFMKTKAGRIHKKHPEWSKTDCELLVISKYWIGMDIEMLKYKRGLPNSANPSNYGNGVTQWQWCWTDLTPSCFYDNDGDGLIDSYN